jgi:Domain of unknown function (DUF4352)
MSNQPPNQPPEGWERPAGEPGPQQPSGQPQGPGWGQQPPGQPYGPPSGQQPAWGQPPPGGPQKPRGPWYRRPWPVIGLAVVVGLVLFSILGALAGDPTTDTASAPATEDESSASSEQGSATTRATTKTTAAPTQEAPGIGDPVRDGKFEFTVQKVDCGKTRIGDQYTNTKAQGQFCLVHLKVENIGKESQLLDGSNQYLYGPGGQRFDADSEAGIYLDDAQTFLEEINPGNTVNGIVVFDIPKSVEPTKIELHDSAFSGGVTVEL